MTVHNAAPAAEPVEHSAPGGAVHSTGLKRREGKLSTLPCGCQSDDTRWLALCDKVHREVLRVKALSRRWIPTLRAADEETHVAMVREAADSIDELLR